MADSLDRARQDAPAGSDVLAVAPGRANLIGEYTDVNDGFVLPVALELTTVLIGRRGGRTLRLRSLDLDPAPVEVDLDTGTAVREGWGRYAGAVVEVLRAEGLALSGVDGVLASDVPLGAGLSSSAALEVAVALAVLEDPIEPLALARLCRRAENEGVGVQSGLMDQLASAASRAGSALLLDCRDESVRHVPVGDSLSVLVIDSGMSRELSGGDYNTRREQCHEAARAYGVPSLRELTSDRLEDRTQVPELLRRRARHVVDENARVLATVEALDAGDREGLGALMAASHASLAHDFEVSTPELDLLVELAVATPGVVGSRLTGAGFGGCTVSLVDAGSAEQAREIVSEQYAARTGRRPRAWLSAPATGARVAAVTDL